MTRRSIVVLSALALSLSTIWNWQRGALIAVRANEGAATSAYHEQATSSDPRSATWEYKILTGHRRFVVRVTSSSDSRGRLLPSSNIERTSTGWAAQGYIVDSFQPFCSAEGGRSGISFPQTGSPELVVLMKRIRK